MGSSPGVDIQYSTSMRPDVLRGELYIASYTTVITTITISISSKHYGFSSSRDNSADFFFHSKPRSTQTYYIGPSTSYHLDDIVLLSQLQDQRLLFILNLDTQIYLTTA